MDVLLAMALITFVVVAWALVPAGAVAALTGLPFGGLLVATGLAAALTASTMVLLQRVFR